MKSIESQTQAARAGDPVTTGTRERVQRLLLVDDHAVVRAGVKSLIQGVAGLAVVGEASDSASAIAEATVLQPDVIVLDVNLPDRSGIEAMADLLRAAPATRVLVLSMQDEPRYARRAFAAGAHGYLLKDGLEGELVDGIRTVASGGRYVSPELGVRVAASWNGPPVSGRPLTEREQEVVRLVARGLTNGQIAKALFLSIRTVESHRARIMRKLGCRDRSELIRYAIENHLVEN
jgi:two-component system response regulator NreC